MNPNQLLETLLQSSTARKRRSLQIIYDVCQEQHKRGSKDFSIASIGRLSEQNKGPITQSIRNPGGTAYQGIIKAWANYTGGSLKKPKKEHVNLIASVINKIPDVAIRALVGTMMAENTKLRGQVNLLKQQSEIVIDQRSSLPSPNVNVMAPSLALTESERNALMYAVSEKFFKDQGWVIGANERVLNEKGNSIFKPGFISGIRKVLFKTTC